MLKRNKSNLVIFIVLSFVVITHSIDGGVCFAFKLESTKFFAAARLQSHIPTTIEQRMQEAGFAVRSEKRIIAEMISRKEKILEILEIVVTKDRPGILNDILEIIEQVDFHSYVDWFEMYEDEGRKVLRFGIETINMKEMIPRLDRIDGIEIAEKEGWRIFLQKMRHDFGQIIGEEPIAYKSFVVQFEIPPGTQNLKKITQVFTDYGINIRSFLAPDFDPVTELSRYSIEIDLNDIVEEALIREGMRMEDILSDPSLLGRLRELEDTLDRFRFLDIDEGEGEEQGDMDYFEGLFHESSELLIKLGLMKLFKNLEFELVGGEVAPGEPETLEVKVVSMNLETLEVKKDKSLIDLLFERELVSDLEIPLSPGATEEIRIALSVLSSKIPKLRKDRRTPYIWHLIETVKMVVNEFRLKDVNAIIATLLHDAIEDRDITESDLEGLFNDERRSRKITRLVTLLTRKDEKNYENERESLLKILNTSGEVGDIAELIKLTDRIHNLRTLDIGDPKFHRRIFFTTLIHFVPLFLDPADRPRPSARYQEALEEARETLKAQIILSGDYFGFIDSRGQIVMDELNSFLEEQKAYLVRDTDHETHDPVFYQKQIDSLFPYFGLARAGSIFKEKIILGEDPHDETIFRGFNKIILGIDPLEMSGSRFLLYLEKIYERYKRYRSEEGSNEDALIKAFDFYSPKKGMAEKRIRGSELGTRFAELFDIPFGVLEIYDQFFRVENSLIGNERLLKSA